MGSDGQSWVRRVGVELVGWGLHGGPGLIYEPVRRSIWLW